MNIKQVKLFKSTTLFLSLTLMISALFFSPFLVSAHSGHSASVEKDKSIEVIVSEIRQSQNLTTGNKVDCTKVSKEKFVELGDAIMEEMHPGAQHELMDRMMGGEGSSSLASMHTMMGRKYLGCATNFSQGNMMMGMGGGSMMNDTDSLTMGRGMMNRDGYFNFGLIWMIFLLILIIAVTIVLSQWLINRRDNSDSKTALDILKERYARGEIKQEEFIDKKKNLG